MIHYIKTFTQDGLPIQIEVEDTSKPAPGFARHTSPTDASNEAVKDAYDQVLNTIRGCAGGVIDTIQNLDTLPNSASIDFAIKVDSEAGAMIAKSREEIGRPL